MANNNKPFKLDILLTAPKKKKKTGSEKSKRYGTPVKKTPYKLSERLINESYLNDTAANTSILGFIDHLHDDVKRIVDNSVKKDFKLSSGDIIIKLDDNYTIVAKPNGVSGGRQRYKYQLKQGRFLVVENTT